MYQKDEKFRVRKFIMGLNPSIGGELYVHGPTSMETVFEKAIKQEQKLRIIYASKEESRRKNRKFQTPTASKPAWKKGNNKFRHVNKRGIAVRTGVNNNKNGQQGTSLSHNKIERKGPLGGCFKCGCDHFANNCL